MGVFFRSRVVIWNISPAPSASLAVIIGVCTRMKPLSLKNLWIAKESRLLTLNTAEKVFVLGLRWAMVLRYSKECLFFWRGNVSSAAPKRVIFVALSSKACFAPSDFMRSPSIWRLLPVPYFTTSLKFSSSCSKTIWRFFRYEPSLSSINPKVFESLRLLTRPFTMILLPISDS